MPQESPFEESAVRGAVSRSRTVYGVYFIRRKGVVSNSVLLSRKPDSYEYTEFRSGGGMRSIGSSMRKVRSQHHVQVDLVAGLIRFIIFLLY